jgi:acetyl esterase/lipase
MSTENKYASILALLVAAWSVEACTSTSNSNAGGTGGGRAGNGGTLATGGAAETGGIPGSGGQTSNGGANGGSAGTGATTMTGGSTGAGGAEPSGGTPGGGTPSSGSPSGGATGGSVSIGGARQDAGVVSATGGATGNGGATGASDASTGTDAGGKTGPAQTIKNINYAGTSAASQTLDLLLPANAPLPLPLVVRVHGGGFSGGDKSGEETGTTASAILAKGYALAAVNYRLSGQALFPAGVQDIKAAVRWLRAHADQYALDSARFACWGESAGGYMVAMLGVTGDQATVFDDDSLGNPRVSSAVAAVVDWYGPTDLATMDSQQTANPPASCPTSWLRHTPATSPEGGWLGGALNSAEVATKVAQANLVAYVPTAKTLPLFVIAHGNDDCNVPWGQSQELKDALAKAGNTANLTIIPGYSHGDSRFETTQTAPDLTLLAALFGR